MKNLLKAIKYIKKAEKCLDKEKQAIFMCELKDVRYSLQGLEQDLEKKELRAPTWIELW